jgi:hypothetical protein
MSEKAIEKHGNYGTGYMIFTPSQFLRDLLKKKQQFYLFAATFGYY